MRRRAAADHKESIRNARPASTRSAGAGGSSGTMLKLYTDESPGLKVDPVVVLVLSLGFIFSVVGLHGMCFSNAHTLSGGHVWVGLKVSYPCVVWSMWEFYVTGCHICFVILGDAAFLISLL